MDKYLDKNMLTEEKHNFLKEKAKEIRQEIVIMITRAASGHVGGSLSAVELVVSCYYHLMKHNAQQQDWSERDRFIMGKGHAAPVIYAVLADCGYFPKDDLLTFRRPGSHLQGHPYALKTPGIEASTGTLGLSLSTTCGMALSAKLKGEKQNYFCLCGDGEIQEGQVWEAAMFANKYKLNNIIAFIDRNYMQSDGYSEDVMPMDPLEPKWEAFGWEVFSIDGHDFEQIINTVEKAILSEKPVMIVARTIKGKGVSFMENDNLWHGNPPNVETAMRALSELV
jgi:transketolase